MAKKILIVDDIPEVRECIRDFLADEGYEIIEAPDGLAGLQSFKENLPDLVITDIVMPKMEGIETIKELFKINSEVKVIAISGKDKGSSTYLKAAELLGAQRIFEKPLDMVRLVDEVKSLLGDA